MIEIIPAIDLKNGTCVRLMQGNDAATTEYSNDPLSVAREWVSQGAKCLHIVNLDGAFGRASGNFEIVASIAQKVDALIEFGGGIRSMADVERAVDAGVGKVVLGTSAVENPDFIRDVLKRFGTQRAVIALDAQHGFIATRGWQTASEITVLELASRMKTIGVTEILYTDIARDGMLSGLDSSTLEQLSETQLSVIASGGVSSTEDVLKLAELNLPNIVGVIIGKALYEQRILLPELITALNNGTG